VFVGDHLDFAAADVLALHPLDGGRGVTRAVQAGGSSWSSPGSSLLEIVEFTLGVVAQR
jgi:hypothetical protein